MDFKEIEDELFDNRSKSQKSYFSSLIPGSKKALGVKVPYLRTMAKTIAKDDYVYFMDNCPEEYYEQEMLKAFVIGYVRDDIEKILVKADEFIPKIHDWAVNDAFCQNFKIARKYQDIVWQWLMKYALMDDEYSQRVVAVLSLSHFLNDEYYKDVLRVVDDLKNPGYYTKMGVAWCVATAYAKFPEYTMEYMKSGNHLDDWTYNKSIQKMIESFKVSDEDKKILRSMKR